MDKNIEEILELLWVFKEHGIPARYDKIVAKSKVDDTSEHLAEMDKKGLVEISGDQMITLTAEGERVGEGIVRRCRLAEWLLSNVLELGKDEWESTACEFEHILSEEVTDSICTFLGHPPACPHGEPIPRGECCKRFSKEVTPLVMNVTEMRPGESGRVVFMSPKNHGRLDKLSSLGLMPGAVVKLHQKQPTFVLIIGETSIAVDHEIAGEIFVKKMECHD
ncbi:MAG: metal-dependent transcriptional regulator [Proteobacteria bacterium]|nr:metal-dependent transcriptional regulator [Pseudomonadota bacterium]